MPLPPHTTSALLALNQKHDTAKCCAHGKTRINPINPSGCANCTRAAFASVPGYQAGKPDLALFIPFRIVAVTLTFFKTDIL